MAEEEKGNKKQRSKLLFNNDTLSDVQFVVRASHENDTKRSKIVIPAHKFVLSVCSPVFFKMFCGEMAENGEQIDLPDCDYEGMFEFLRYIYTDEVCLNGNNVLQVLYLAEKYMVPCLVEECVEFLKRNLHPSNVFCVFKHAQKYGKKDLLCHCWYLIERKTKEVLTSSDFLTIEKSLLEQLVERNSLNIKEVELFKAVDRWAEKECERLNLKDEGSVKRQILGEQIVKNIRFPAMKQSDFMEVAFGSKILTEQETSDIMNHFSSPLSSTVSFLEMERVGSCLRCCRIEAFETDCFNWKNEDNNSPYITEVTVDKDIVLYGVSLFGNEDAKYTATVKVLNDYGSILAVKSGAFTSSRTMVESWSKIYSYYGFDVLFDDPVTLEKDECYFVGTNLDGPDSCVKGWLVSDVRCVDDHSAGVKFSFKGLLYDEDDEVVEEIAGQIPELLFKLKE
ncbi:hypothetical protein ACROYT_G036615 [Oculina patagonica]